MNGKKKGNNYFHDYLMRDLQDVSILAKPMLNNFQSREKIEDNPIVKTEYLKEGMYVDGIFMIKRFDLEHYLYNQGEGMIYLKNQARLWVKSDPTPLIKKPLLRYFYFNI